MSSRVACLVSSNCHLPVHQPWQNEVTGLGETINCLLEIFNLKIYWPYVFYEHLSDPISGL